MVSRVGDAFAEFQIEIAEIRDVGERIVAIGHLRARGKESGADVDSPIGYVAEFRNGRVSRLDDFFDPRDALKPWGCRSRRVGRERGESAPGLDAFNRRDKAAFLALCDRTSRTFRHGIGRSPTRSGVAKLSGTSTSREPSPGKTASDAGRVHRCRERQDRGTGEEARCGVRANGAGVPWSFWQVVTSATGRHCGSNGSTTGPRPSKPWGCRSRRCRRRTWRLCARSTTRSPGVTT